jgi:hypothetical protein
VWERFPRQYTQDQIKAAGYDGVVYTNRGEPTVRGDYVIQSWTDPDYFRTYSGVGVDPEDLDDSYIVFDPTQIKSTKNLGTFDPSNPNVRLGLAGAALGAQALTDEDQRGLTAAGLIVIGSGGRVNPSQAAAAARAVGRSTREAEQIVRAVRAPILARLGGQLRGALLADELGALQHPDMLEQVRTAYAKLDKPELLAQPALAGAAATGGYKRTAEMFTNTFGPDAPIFAAIMAATSPQSTVARNLGNALDTYAAWVWAGRPMEAGAVRAVVRRLSPEIQSMYTKNLQRVLTAPDPIGVALSGPKVSNFAKNLVGDVQRVTLDTWMTRLQGMDPEKLRVRRGAEKISVASGAYLAYSARERQTAEWLTRSTGVEWSPAMVQEAQWAWTKDLAEGTPGGDFTHSVEAVPLAERVGETDPARMRDAWDVPALMTQGAPGDVLNRLDLAGELRGRAPHTVPDWPVLGRPIAGPAFRDKQTGEIIAGTAGQSHADILPADDLPWSRLEDGFVDARGQFLTRTEAANVMGRGQPLDASTLALARGHTLLPAPDLQALQFLAKNRVQPSLLGRYRLGIAGGVLGYGAAQGLLNENGPQTPPYLRPGPGLLAGN